MNTHMDRRISRLEAGGGADVDIAALIEAGRRQARSMTPDELRASQQTRLDALLDAARDRRLSQIERLVVEGMQRAMAADGVAA